MSANISDIAREMVGVRHDLHANPQTGNEETYAQDVIETHLSDWGIPYEGGWGKAGTGIVATIEGRSTNSEKVIGLRADMDALNIDGEEETGISYASKTPGKMHACGHDGHVATMLATAKYLSLTKKFNGTAKLVFQPAEEGMGGAKAMIEQGLFEQHPMDSIHAIHAWPYLGLGTIAIHRGAVMASSDYFESVITGKGGHAGKPDDCINPLVIGASLVNYYNDQITRRFGEDGAKSLGLCCIKGGKENALTTIPSEAFLAGTIRTHDPDMRAFIKNLITVGANQFCEGMGAVGYNPGFREGNPPTINDEEKAAASVRVARRVFGKENVFRHERPEGTAEDFGRMLGEVPGTLGWLGQGDLKNPDSPNNKPLHNKGFDFNDDAIEKGAEFLVELVESELSF